MMNTKGWIASEQTLAMARRFTLVIASRAKQSREKMKNDE
jgi:hypothetical protein